MESSMAQFLQIKHAKPYNGKDIANSNHSKIFFGYKSGVGVQEDSGNLKV